MPFKYAPEPDPIWVDIARRTSPSRLLFFRGQPDSLSRQLEARLQSAFTMAGLDFASHVIFIPWQDQAGFFGVMRAAHLYLDSPGFSGFNTVMQAIECGLPVVAFEGAFLRGRFASGILHELDLGDCVADTPAAFVDTVVRLLDEPQRLAAVRAQIEKRSGQLFRDDRAGRAMQSFLLEVTA
jgi:predicted O-linked N-acetylglucosamine transferase (SPINDLY family)